MSHEHIQYTVGTAFGAGGALLNAAMLPTIPDVMHTVVIAMVGAFVGFFTTLALKYLQKVIKSKWKI